MPNKSTYSILPIAKLIEFLNKTLETSNQMECKIAFSKEQIPYTKLDMRGLISISKIVQMIQGKSKTLKHSTVSSKSKVKN